jgi:serine/threonine protein kinase
MARSGVDDASGVHLAERRVSRAKLKAHFDQTRSPATSRSKVAFDATPVAAHNKAKTFFISEIFNFIIISDITSWSFGILLYEIVTLGATPYPSIGPEQLLKILNTGYRMEKPRHCHDSLYELMMSCWHANPTDRPSFEELSDKLSRFLQSRDELHIDLIELFDKCTSEM